MMLTEINSYKFYENMAVESSNFKFPGVGYTPIRDIRILLTLMRVRKPASYLEVGVNQGHTAECVLANFPDMKVVGVDPGDKIGMSGRPDYQKNEFKDQSQIGIRLAGTTALVIKESFSLDILPEGSTFDFIFIDGCHEYDYVMADTLAALKILNPGGTICWHDYGKVNSDITRVVRDIKEPVIGIPDTWMAYYLK